MLGSVVLDTAIGLVFVFLLASLISTGTIEWISNKFNKRGEYLLRGLREMLDIPPATPGEADRPGAARGGSGAHAATQGLLETKNRRRTLQVLSESAEALPWQLSGSTEGGVRPEPGLADLVLGHPVVVALHRPAHPGRPRGDMRLASYLSARTFARTLIDLLVLNGAGHTTLDELTAQVAKLDPSVPARAALLGLLRDAGRGVEEFQRDLEQWYDEQMDRVTGWYKRWAQWRLLLVGLGLALLFNVDSVRVGRVLYRDGPVRDAVVAQAVSAQGCPSEEGPERDECLARQQELLRELPLPLGWNLDAASAACRESSADRACGTSPTRWVSFAWYAATRQGLDSLLLKLFGWLLTAAAVALGAPFWFDALSRLGSLRTAGRRPAEARAAPRQDS